jgi:hypothetical protein
MAVRRLEALADLSHGLSSLQVLGKVKILVKRLNLFWNTVFDRRESNNSRHQRWKRKF